MRLLLANRPFVRFWSAGLFFLLAMWSLHVAMLIHVFDLTGSPFATGLIPVFSALPGIIFGPIAGVLVDRWDRRRVMVVSTLVIAALLVAALPLALAGEVRPALLFGIIFLQAIAMAFFSPAENALLPRLVGEDDLRIANALNALNDSLARIAGPAVGAVVLIRFGFEATLVCCVILYLVAAALLVGVRVPARLIAAGTTFAGAVVTPISIDVATGLAGVRRVISSVWRELGDGLRVVRANRLLLLSVAAFGLYMLADVPLSAVLPAFLSGTLGAGAEGVGTSLALRGVAGVIGGLLIAAISHRVDERHLLAAGLLIYGASVATMGMMDSFGIVLLLLIPIGPAAAAIQTGLFTLLQKGSTDAVRGRVFGLVGTVNGVITLTASLAAGSLAEVSGVRTVVILSGCLHLLPLLLVLTRIRPATSRSATRSV